MPRARLDTAALRQEGPRAAGHIRCCCVVLLGVRRLLARSVRHIDGACNALQQSCDAGWQFAAARGACVAYPTELFGVAQTMGEVALSACDSNGTAGGPTFLGDIVALSSGAAFASFVLCSQWLRSEDPASPSSGFSAREDSGI